ncbi:unnamed protein product, partial [Scytosiphon promiscuus]
MALMRCRRRGDGSSTRKIACSRNQASGSVLVLLSTTSGVAAATDTSGIMIDRSPCSSTGAAFLGATGFVPRQRQRQQKQQMQHTQQKHKVFRTKGVIALHQTRGSDPNMQSSRTHDPRRTRTLPIRPLPPSATAGPAAPSLLPPPLTGDKEAMDTRRPTVADDLPFSSKLPTRQGASASSAGRPAVGRDELSQDRRGPLPVQVQRHQGQKHHCGPSAMPDKDPHQQHLPASNDGDSSSSGGSSLGTNNPSPIDGPGATAATTMTTTAAATADAANTASSSSRASAYRSRPVTPRKLPHHLEYLLGRGDWREAVAAFEKSRKHQAARRGAASAAAGEKDARALLSLGAYNQALMAYAQGRDGRSALELLREMRRAGGRLTPSRGSFNACLDACRYGGQRNKVMSVLEMMVEDGVPPSGKSYSSALQACAKEGNVADARKMLGWMWTSPDLEGGIKGLRPTTWGYNCAMEACARSGDWESALELMAEMSSKDLKHDAFTYGAALEACGRTGNWQKAEAIVEQLADAYTKSLAELPQKASSSGSGNGAAADTSKSALTPTTVHCNALLQSYSRGKRVDKAVRMLEHMLKLMPSGTPGGVTASSATMDAKGKWDSTDDGGDVSEKDGGDEDGRVPRWDSRLPLSRPDAISFGTVIDGCSRARMADKAIDLLRVMREERIGDSPVGHTGSRGAEGAAGGGNGHRAGGGRLPVLPPNVHCVTAAVTACGRASRVEEAIAVLREAVVLEDAWLHQQRQPAPPTLPLPHLRQEDGAQEGVSSAAGAAAATATAAAGLARKRQPQGEVGESARVMDESSAPILKGSVEREGEGVFAAATVHPSAVSANPGEKVAEEAVKNDGEVTAVDGPVAAAPVAAAVGAAMSSRKVAADPAAASTGTVTAVAAAAAAAGERNQTRHNSAKEPGGGGVYPGALQPAYNAAINACVEAGRPAEARELIKDMRERGLRPGRECFNSLLVSCCDSHEALDLLAEMERSRVAPDVASYTAAIGACSRGGDLPAALALFETMQRPPSAAAATGATSLTAFAAGKSSSTSNSSTGEGGLAKGGLRGIRGPPRADAQAYGAAAAACARGLDHKAAVRLLAEMRQAGLRPGRPMFGAVMDACARRGKWEEAIKLLEEMTESGVAPALAHYSSAIFACSLGENPTKGLELLSSMRKKRVHANSTCVNAAIHGFALLGDWKTALEILGAMEKAFQVVPDAVSYNTAMKACFRAGQNHKGLALFDRMRSYPPAPPRALGGGSSSDLTKASATKRRKPPATFPKFQVLFPPNGVEGASAGGASDAASDAAVEIGDDPGSHEGPNKGLRTAREGMDASDTQAAGASAGVAPEATRG